MHPNVQTGSALPAPKPLVAAPGPQVVPNREDERKPTSKLLILLVILAVAGAGYWLWQKQQAADRESAQLREGMRTATVQTGYLERSMRIGGVTAAEKFVTLIAPQIRGNRNGRGRGSFSLAGMEQASVASLAPLGGGRTSTGSGSSSGSAQAAGAAGAVESSGGGAARTFGGSNATRAASSRVSSGSSAKTFSGTSSSSSGSSASLGSDGLGSTSRELGSGLGNPGGGGGGQGGGGGGGGGGDFTLILQDLIKPGSIVQKGAVVAEFDRQYMLTRLDDYKSTMETAKAQLAQQKSNLELARYTHLQNVEKAKAALDKAKLDMKTIPVLSTIDAERTKLSLEEADAQHKQQVAEGKFIEQQEKAQLKYAELEFRSLEMEYKRAELNADRMVSKAAIPGMTVMQNMWRGTEMSQIQAGDQIWPGQFFMQIVDPNSMIINATVNQVDGERLRIGQKARIHFDAYPGLEVPARIVNIAAVPKSGGQRASFVREIPVRLKIDRMDPRIIPDLSVSVDVVLAEEPEATIAPLAGIFDAEQPGKKVVYIKQGEAWDRREVELGIDNYLVVSVKGLRKGDVIALDKPPAQPKG